MCHINFLFINRARADSQRHTLINKLYGCPIRRSALVFQPARISASCLLVMWKEVESMSLRDYRLADRGSKKWLQKLVNEEPVLHIALQTSQKRLKTKASNGYRREQVKATVSIQIRTVLSSLV